MEKFKILVNEVEASTIEADKFYIDHNMQAGKRLFTCLMNIERKCKIAREELSEERKKVREQRQIQNGRNI